MGNGEWGYRGCGAHLFRVSVTSSAPGKDPTIIIQMYMHRKGEKEGIGRDKGISNIKTIIDEKDKSKSELSTKKPHVMTRL